MDRYNSFRRKMVPEKVGVLNREGQEHRKRKSSIKRKKGVFATAGGKGKWVQPDAPFYLS